MLSSLIFLLCFQSDLYSQAMKKLYAGDSKLAIELMEQGLDETGSSKYFFGIAWIEYARMNYSESERLLNHIIEGAPKDDRLGASLYLLGIIYFQRPSPDYEKSMECLAKAKEIFTSLDDINSVAKVYFALAELGFEQENLAEAKKNLLFLYRVLDNTDFDKGDFYYLEGRLEWTKGNFKGAYNFGLKSNKHFSGRSDIKEILSLLNMALYSTCRGLEEKDIWLEKAKKLYSSGKYDAIEPWMEAIEALVSKCSKLSGNSSNRKKKEGMGKSYGILWEFIKDFDCENQVRP